MSDGYRSSKKTDTICEDVCGQVWLLFLYFSSDPILVLIQGLGCLIILNPTKECLSLKTRLDDFCILFYMKSCIFTGLRVT